ncbi:MAG: hypothetical protein ACFFB3_04350 [Candidatus Hodarchaeota archaeon]
MVIIKYQLYRKNEDAEESWVAGAAANGRMAQLRETITRRLIAGFTARLGNPTTPKDGSDPI